jgi:hypothetical protein
MISIYEYRLKNNLFMEQDAPAGGAPPPAAGGDAGGAAPPPAAGGDAGGLGGGLGGALGGGGGATPPAPDLGGGLGGGLGGAVGGGGAGADITTKLEIYNWDSILQEYFKNKDKESDKKRDRDTIKRLSAQFF